MLISCNKLKSYIKNSEDIDFLNLWKTFTVRTAEVEDVKVVGNTFDGVVVAEIKECIPHPDSDHMHVLKVDTGKDELTEVVCGAPNVRVGLKTAFVQVGGYIDGIKITARPLRGIVSNGMCCSGKELSISDNHEGILEFPTSWINGTDVKKYLPIEDIIVEIDNKSLTNRPDLWGHYGIAREVAAITNHELFDLDLFEIKNDKQNLDIEIKNPELCMRYCGLTIDNIKNNVTPLEMQIFLYYVGMRSISLIVDLTNYVMLELGQPMHAFDSRIVKKIEVGLANDKDKYTTLDGVERNLTKDNLMIKNDNKYFAIAGVMGGLDSEILSDTASIFLEGATFNAGSIRKTAVALGLRTEASSRYEKSLDPNMAIIAMRRFTYLLSLENPDMIITSNLTDNYPTVLTEGTIILKKELLNKYMNKPMSEILVKDLLEKIGFKVTINEDNYEVIVPTFRHSKDVNIAQDLIEEISRLNGLENLKATPLCLDLESHAKETIYNEEYDVKKMLATKYDMHEVNSYLWYDSTLLKELNIEKDGVKLISRNDSNILRDDLCLSLMNIINENFKKYSKFDVFEIGTVIKNKENKRALGIILCSEEKELENTYNKAKSIVSYLFDYAKHLDTELKKSASCETYYERSLSKDIIVNNDIIGQINVLNKLLTNKISKKKSIICINIDYDAFSLLKINDIFAQSVSKYPMVELDYTVIVNGQKYENLKEILKSYKSNIIKSYELIGIYENKYTIRYHVGSNNKTLEQKDLQDFKERFIKHIKDNNLSIIE